MFRKLFASCLLGAAAFSAAAVESTVTYTYAGDEAGFWGKGKSEIYDVAIRISDPALAGKKITAIRAVVNAYEGIESTSVWLSKELTLEKIDGVKVTVPDTYSSEVSVEKITFPGDEFQCGQLSASLDTPYVLTEEGIYVGYSLTVPSVPKGEELTNMQKYPLLLSPCDNRESLYMRASKDFLKWVPYNDKLGGAAMIYVTLEGDFAEYCVGIKNLPMVYAKVGEDFVVKTTLSNIGASPVSKIGYSYSVAGKTIEKTFDLSSPIAPDFVNNTVVELPIDAIEEIGEYPLDLKITTVDGGENASSTASASTKVSVLPFVPVHRPMLEEFTGTWCGWCTRGYWALEKLNELYGDAVVLAAYHNGDPMTVTSSYPVPAGTRMGFPSGQLNRNGIEDPYYGNANDGFGMGKEVAASMEIVVPADIQVNAAWSNEEKTEIKIVSTATFLENKENAGYKIGYLLINNGLSGEGDDWGQHNYFPGYASQYAGTDLEVLTTWPSVVEGLVFNDVVVDVAGMMGVDGSVPANVEYNTPYDNEFSFDIADNEVIQDKDKLYVAAFIINPNGTILNSNKVKVDGFTAVNAI
ncbi:MAG: hypothetical protein K2L11_04185, partial [Muribaculaceae bacterium]|nr:hypothetical protein [Muribaculaceae bacterium]